MSHLDAGAITTLRDRALVDDDVRRHAETCPVCRQALDDARGRQDHVGELLRSLDVPGAPDVEAAKRKVRLRLDRRREAAHRPRPLFPVALGRAAALLLVAAGVAYALPGSPLRSWLTDGGGSGIVPTSTVTGEAATAFESVQVPVPPSGLRIALLDVAPDMPVEVRWIEGEQARIAGGPEARYAISEGRTEARVASGPIRLELPRSGPRVTVELDGLVVLTRSDAGVEVSAEVLERDADGLVLTVGAR